MPHPPTPPRPRPRRAKAPLGAAQRRRADHPNVPAVEPGPATHRQQPSSGAPNRDRLTPTRTNTGSAETRATGYGADRVGKQFTVKYLGNGRVAHVYGSDVPADQRRQVFKRAAKRRAA